MANHEGFNQEGAAELSEQELAALRACQSRGPATSEYVDYNASSPVPPHVEYPHASQGESQAVPQHAEHAASTTEELVKARTEELMKYQRARMRSTQVITGDRRLRGKTDELAANAIENPIPIDVSIGGNPKDVLALITVGNRRENPKAIDNVEEGMLRATHRFALVQGRYDVGVPQLVRLSDEQFAAGTVEATDQDIMPYNENSRSWDAGYPDTFPAPSPLWTKGNANGFMLGSGEHDNYTHVILPDVETESRQF